MSAGQPSQDRVGRYILEHRVASGGMGEVFSARAVGAAGTSKRVCIKRILASRKLSEGAVAHFISEATLSMQLSHANIVPVFDFGSADDGYYLVMEWVDGVDMGAVLEATRTRGEPLTVAEISYIGARLAHGLAHAHSRNIVHRDVKPANVLLSRAGQVHLTDFGVAMLSGTELPAAGTPAYMAPEQRWGIEVDGRADVFAMGVTLNHLATGALSRDPNEVRKVAPAPLAELLARMVAPLAEDRPGSMEEVARELERLESVSIAGGAELPRVSLQRRVADMTAGNHQGPSLEVVFLTAASFAAPPGTAPTLTAPPEPGHAQDAEGANADVEGEGAARDLALLPTLDAARDAAATSGAATPSSDPGAAAPSSDPGAAAAPPNAPARRRVLVGGALLLVAGLAGGIVQLARRGTEGPPDAPGASTGLGSADANASQPVAAADEGPPRPADGLEGRGAGGAEGRVAEAAGVVAGAPSTPTPAPADGLDSAGGVGGSPAHGGEPASVRVTDEPTTAGGVQVGASDDGAPTRVTSSARSDGRATSRDTGGVAETGAGMAQSPAESSDPSTTESAASATQSAYLHIGARPWAEVYVDGRRVGQTPITALALPPGRHQVRLVNGPLDAQRTIDVRLSSGETRYIREQME
ncbi:MAG: protein kinase [Polyangiales bacterium]